MSISEVKREIMRSASLTTGEAQNTALSLEQLEKTIPPFEKTLEIQQEAEGHCARIAEDIEDIRRRLSALTDLYAGGVTLSTQVGVSVGAVLVGEAQDGLTTQDNIRTAADPALRALMLDTETAMAERLVGEAVDPAWDASKIAGDHTEDLRRRMEAFVNGFVLANRSAVEAQGILEQLSAVRDSVAYATQAAGTAEYSEEPFKTESTNPPAAIAAGIELHGGLGQAAWNFEKLAASIGNADD